MHPLVGHIVVDGVEVLRQLRLLSGLG
jgi:hypothetical protein